ncbi:MAG: tetratricopeptide repeat protein [Deltaproteobacteria bacterium]|nr:tetratricopeptide repeat protein [Deltaproteobacteria bacterium]
MKPRVFLFFCVILLLNLQFVSGCAPESAAREFDEAEGLLAEGRYTEAAGMYMAVFKGYPKSPYAPKSLFKLGLVHATHLNNPERAIEFFGELSSFYPESNLAVTAIKEKARAYSELGAHGKAIEEYERLIEKSPHEKDYTRYLISLEYIKLSDFERARTGLNDVLTSSPNTRLKPEIYYQIASIYYLEGKAEAAFEWYSHFLENYPDHQLSGNAKLARALSLEEAGRLKEALVMFKALLAEDPEAPSLKVKVEAINKRLAMAPSTKERARKKGF